LYNFISIVDNNDIFQACLSPPDPIECHDNLPRIDLSIQLVFNALSLQISRLLICARSKEETSSSWRSCLAIPHYATVYPCELSSISLWSLIDDFMKMWLFYNYKEYFDVLVSVSEEDRQTNRLIILPGSTETRVISGLHRWRRKQKSAQLFLHLNTLFYIEVGQMLDGWWFIPSKKIF